MDEPDGITTRYIYDVEGNLKRKELANGTEYSYEYDSLGRMRKEKNPGDEPVEYNYDEAGRMEERITPRGIKEVYSYYPDGQVEEIEYYRPDENGDYPEEPQEVESFKYDRANNKEEAEKTKEEKTVSKIVQDYDALNRITEEKRTIEGTTYITGYQYDRHGNLTGIKYPGSSEYLEYNYDDLNQLKSIEDIAGSEDDPAFDYYQNGSLEEARYDNGIVTGYDMDENARTDDINVTEEESGETLLELDYDYDKAGNVARRNNNSYEYDSLNRLDKAENLEGTFYRKEEDDYGYVTEDHTGQRGLDTTVEVDKEITLDYAAGSIGINFGTEVEGLARIELKTIGTADHRLNKESLEIYSGDGDGTYEEISRDKWSYTQDHAGNIQILLEDGINARELKVHCNFDDWAPGLDEDGEIIRENRGEFTNLLEEMITVYSRRDRGKIDYAYD